MLMRLIMFLLLPVRLPFMLLRWLFTFGRRAAVVASEGAEAALAGARTAAGEAGAAVEAATGEAESAIARGLRAAAGDGRSAEAVAAGGAARVVHRKDEKEDERSARLFRPFKSKPSDEPKLEELTDAELLELAEKMAKRAKTYFKRRPPLFSKPGPKASGPGSEALGRDFYEDVEFGFIEEVTNIDMDGKLDRHGKPEPDQFVALMVEARKNTNTNARILYCWLAPMMLVFVLIVQAALLILDPLQMLEAPASASTIEAYLREGGSAIATSASVLGFGVIVAAFVYGFPFVNTQRLNGQELNKFVQTEFARLNNAFNVAHRECLRAEARVGDSEDEHNRVGRIAAQWALAREWISVRQLTQEMALRNVMFQVRRNTSFYGAGGLLLCVLLASLTIPLVVWASPWADPAIGGSELLFHEIALAAAFVVVAFGVVMRGPFSAFASALEPDEWFRFDKLDIGRAIEEQISNDKLQIVTHRDRGGRR